MIHVVRIALLATFACLAFVASAQEPMDSDPQGESKGPPVVVVKTSKGDIKIELDADKAPITVENFLRYVDEDHYSGTIFHRVISSFMIQGGGFTKDGGRKPTAAPIKNEADNGLKNKRGTIAMARTQDINSATCQFFINVVDNSMLDHSPRGFGYCVFGKVVEGMDVVDEIRSVKTGRHGPYGDWPEEPIEILEVVREPAS
jgi:cyclophilin family peptidyl-prolyl cis-trans isomerase